MQTVKMFFVFLAFSSITFLTACNTVHGAGEDLQAGGHAITKAVDDAKKK